MRSVPWLGLTNIGSKLRTTTERSGSESGMKRRKLEPVIEAAPLTTIKSSRLFLRNSDGIALGRQLSTALSAGLDVPSAKSGPTQS